MLRKNTAGQVICFSGINASTGAALTGATFSCRRCLDGTFAAATGSITEDTGLGFYKMALSQADTNGNNCSYFFTATNAIPVTINVITTVLDPTSTAFGLSIAKTTNITGFNDIAATAVVSGGAITTSGGAVSTVTTATNVTTVNGLAAGVITATSIAADAITDAKVAADVTIASVTGAVGSVTGNVGGNVVGSVGSVVGAVGSVTGAVGSVTGAVGSVTAAVTVGTNNDKTGYALSATGSAALTEGYAALGAAATLPQLLYEVRALLAEKSISGTTLTAKKLDGSTTAATYTLDDATTPSAITRAT